jgi:hypothetical protein
MEITDDPYAPSFHLHCELDSRVAELSKPNIEAKLTIAEYEKMYIGVAVADARETNSNGEKVGKTVLWPQSFLAPLDQFERQRLVTMAEAIKARFIAVERPGVGVDERANPGMGLFERLNGINKNAYDMLGALKEVVPDVNGGELELALYSQGAVIGGHMIKHFYNKAHGLDVIIPKITVIEDVNDTTFNLALIAKIGSEDTDRDPKTKIKVEHNVTDRYLQENDRFNWLTWPTDRMSFDYAMEQFILTEQTRDKLNKLPFEKKTGKAVVDAVKGTFDKTVIDGLSLIHESFPNVMQKTYDKQLSNVSAMYI